jgi:hypothetical protein
LGAQDWVLDPRSALSIIGHPGEKVPNRLMNSQAAIVQTAGEAKGD